MWRLFVLTSFWQLKTSHIYALYVLRWKEQEASDLIYLYGETTIQKSELHPFRNTQLNIPVFSMDSFKLNAVRGAKFTDYYNRSKRCISMKNIQLLYITSFSFTISEQHISHLEAFQLFWTDRAQSFCSFFRSASINLLDWEVLQMNSDLNKSV